MHNEYVYEVDYVITGSITVTSSCKGLDETITDKELKDIIFHDGSIPRCRDDIEIMEVRYVGVE